MALHGCLRCLKYVVFTMNFVVWLAGMAILGLAVYLRMDPRVNHFVMAGYTSEVSTYHLICYILIGAGGVMTFVGFLGCCGAFQESRCMLGTFFVFLCVICAAQIAGGVLAFVRKELIQDYVTSSMKTLIQEEYGKEAESAQSVFQFDSIDQSVDYVQRTLQCCGAEGPTDWWNSRWFDGDFHRRQLNQVPSSCCKENRLPNAAMSGFCGVEAPWIDGKRLGVWEKGCSNKLIKEFHYNLLIVIAVGLGIAAVEIMSLMFSLILCCGMRRQSAGGYKS